MRRTKFLIPTIASICMLVLPACQKTETQETEHPKVDEHLKVDIPAYLDAYRKMGIVLVRSTNNGRKIETAKEMYKRVGVVDFDSSKYVPANCGTAFLFSLSKRHAYFATAAHVVHFAECIDLFVPGSQEKLTAHEIGNALWCGADISILQTERKGWMTQDCVFPIIPAEESEKLRIGGAEMLILGFPYSRMSPIQANHDRSPHYALAKAEFVFRDFFNAANDAGSLPTAPNAILKSGAYTDFLLPIPIRWQIRMWPQDSLETQSILKDKDGDGTKGMSGGPVLLQEHPERVVGVYSGVLTSAEKADLRNGYRSHLVAPVVYLEALVEDLKKAKKMP